MCIQYVHGHQIFLLHSVQIACVRSIHDNTVDVQPNGLRPDHSVSEKTPQTKIPQPQTDPDQSCPDKHHLHGLLAAVRHDQ